MGPEADEKWDGGRAALLSRRTATFQKHINATAACQSVWGRREIAGFETKYLAHRRGQ